MRGRAWQPRFYWMDLRITVEVWIELGPVVAGVNLPFSKENRPENSQKFPVFFCKNNPSTLQYGSTCATPSFLSALWKSVPGWSFEKLWNTWYTLLHKTKASKDSLIIHFFFIFFCVVRFCENIMKMTKTMPFFLKKCIQIQPWVFFFWGITKIQKRIFFGVLFWFFLFGFFLKKKLFLF